MPIDLSELVAVAVRNMNPIVLAILSVAAGLKVLAVTFTACYIVIATARGQRFIGGRIYQGVGSGRRGGCGRRGRW
jgi:hypothetical protein